MQPANLPTCQPRVAGANSPHLTGNPSLPSPYKFLSLQNDKDLVSLANMTGLYPPTPSYFL